MLWHLEAQTFTPHVPVEQQQLPKAHISKCHGKTIYTKRNSGSLCRLLHWWLNLRSDLLVGGGDGQSCWRKATPSTAKRKLLQIFITCKLEISVEVLFWIFLPHWLWSGWQRGRSSSLVKSKNFLLSTSSSRIREPTHPPIQWARRALFLGVKRSGRKADHSPPTNVEIKNTWVYTSNPPYVFIA
jgi:hypothetical protein